MENVLSENLKANTENQQPATDVKSSPSLKRRLSFGNRVHTDNKFSVPEQRASDAPVSSAFPFPTFYSQPQSGHSSDVDNQQAGFQDGKGQTGPAAASIDSAVASVTDDDDDQLSLSGSDKSIDSQQAQPTAALRSFLNTAFGRDIYAPPSPFRNQANGTAFMFPSSTPKLEVESVLRVVIGQLLALMPADDEMGQIDILVHHMDAWNSFWTWLIKLGEREEFEKAMKEFHTVLAKNTTPRSRQILKLELNTPVLVKTDKHDDQIRRAVIVRIGTSSPQKTYIRLMDSGKVEALTDGEFYRMPAELLALPPFAKRCKMPQLGYGFQAHDRMFFERKIGQALSKTDLVGRIEGRNDDYVELGIYLPKATTLPGMEFSVNYVYLADRLLQYGFQGFDLTIPPRTGEYKVTSGEMAATVIFVDENNLSELVVWSRKMGANEQSRNLSRSMARLFQTGENDEIPMQETQPESGKFVAMRCKLPPSKGKTVGSTVYFRGQVTSTDFNNTATVFMLDQGRTLAIDFESLRALEPQDMEIPPLAIKCRVPELASLSAEDQKIVLNILNGAMVTTQASVPVTIKQIFGEDGKAIVDDGEQRLGFVEAEIKLHGKNLRDLAANYAG